MVCADELVLQSMDVKALIATVCYVEKGGRSNVLSGLRQTRRHDPIKYIESDGKFRCAYQSANSS